VATVGLVLEYEGTRYHGFQYQRNAPTIQAEVETALHRLTRECIRVRAASRTDAGAHAKGQVLAFETSASYPPAVFRRGLNAMLPSDIAVQEAYGVREGFHPRREAISRRYCYTIWNDGAPSPLWRRFAHQSPRPLDGDVMEEAAQQLIGCHDFRAFSGPLPAGRTSVRQMHEARVWREGKLIRLELVGNAFLPHQVCRTAGALVRVGEGKLSPEEFGSFLDPERSIEAGPALPPHGLCLLEVTFADFPPKDRCP